MPTDRSPGQFDRAEPRSRNDNQEATDLRFMEQALALARASIGLASPNPRVGCVLVRDGVVIGRGEHHYDRRDHAEIVALHEAGEAARGATAYVTLEPCSHHGRTGPCADALIAAGIARVVAATGDPNPQVNGAGFAKLRAAGVDVTIGVLREEARALNAGFARRVRSGLPFVTVKAGVSLDGRIAPAASERAGSSVIYLTGARSLMAVQTMRHGNDALLTGIGTVLADDPLLTDRSGLPRRRRLLRVVLDSSLRLPLSSRIVTSAADDVLVFAAEPPAEPEPGPHGGERAAKAPDESVLHLVANRPPATEAFHARRARLEQAGVEVRLLPRTPSGQLNLPAVLALLASEYGVLNLMAEGGSRLTRALLEGQGGSQLADRLTLFYAPIFLGEAGVPLIAGTGPLPIEISRFSVSECGSDFCMEVYLRDPWAAPEA